MIRAFLFRNMVSGCRCSICFRRDFSSRYSELEGLGEPKYPQRKLLPPLPPHPQAVGVCLWMNFGISLLKPQLMEKGYPYINKLEKVFCYALSATSPEKSSKPRKLDLRIAYPKGS